MLAGQVSGGEASKRIAGANEVFAVHSQVEAIPRIRRRGSFCAGVVRRLRGQILD